MKQVLHHHFTSLQTIVRVELSWVRFACFQESECDAINYQKLELDLEWEREKERRKIAECILGCCHGNRCCKFLSSNEYIYIFQSFERGGGVMNKNIYAGFQIANPYRRPPIRLDFSWSDWISRQIVSGELTKLEQSPKTIWKNLEGLSGNISKEMTAIFGKDMDSHLAKQFFWPSIDPKISSFAKKTGSRDSPLFVLASIKQIPASQKRILPTQDLEATRLMLSFPCAEMLLNLIKASKQGAEPRTNEWTHTYAEALGNYMKALVNYGKRFFQT